MDIPIFESIFSIPLLGGGYLTTTRKSAKIVDENDQPLVRLDQPHGHNSEVHLQYGGTPKFPDIDRTGQDAEDVFQHIVLAKLRVDMFDKK